MKNRYGIFIATLLLLSAAAVEARAQGLGVSAGLNFNELSEISGDTDATFENAQGWHVAIWFDLPLGPVAIRPGLRYMDAGQVFESKDILGARENFKVQLIEIPLDVRVRLGFPVIAPYVLAGPVLRFPTSTESGNDSRLESFSFAGELGVGVEINLVGIRLFPELKYTFGVSRFTDESYTIGDVTFTPDDDQQLNAVMLSLGIGL